MYMSNFFFKKRHIYKQKNLENKMKRKAETEAKRPFIKKRKKAKRPNNKIIHDIRELKT